MLRALFMVFLVCFSSICVGVVWAGQDIEHLKHKVTQLERACIPTDTGGGVTQCRQPNVSDLAWVNCLANDAYWPHGKIDRQLLIQCIGDYRER